MTEITFSGIMTPLLVPLDEDEKLIEPDLRAHINSLIDSGINGFLSPSSTGEFANLSLKTRQHILEVTIDETASRVPVVALLGECGTKSTISNIRFAARLGVDAVMSTPPYYYPLEQPALASHFKALADEGTALWLYQQPNDTKLSIEHETLLQLAEHPNISGIKVSTNNLLYYHRVVRLFKNNSEFTVLFGEDHSLVSALCLGGDGVISFLSNIIPKTIINLFSAVKSQNLPLAREHQEYVMKCYEAFFTLNNHNPIAACKRILLEKGIFSSDHTTDPFPKLTFEDLKLVVQKATSFGIIT